MKKSAAFLLGALAALTACSSSGGRHSAGGGDRVRIFYNNDNFSYLEPCGCRISPIGGMDRRWNAMVAYPEESRVFVDAGNLLFKSTQATDYLSPQWAEQATGVVEAYNILKADAVEPGSTDFALGLDKFLELSKQAHFPFISANLYRKGGERLLKDSVIIERYGKKIGIFGIFHPSLPLPPELEARDPVAAARAEVKKLRGQGADMVIALAHEGYDRDVVLAKEVPGIDLIVGANSQSLLQSPDQQGDTLVVQLSNQGQMLGMVEYDAKELPKKRTDFVVAELNAEYNNPPKSDMANPMKALVSVTNLKMAEANKKLDERIWAAHQAQNGNGYQTLLSCRDCHTKQAEFQEGKLHAASFLTLVARKKENNLDCVKCHSVGMGQPGGFQSLADAFRDASGEPIPYAKIRAAMGKNLPAANVDYRANPAHIRPDVARFIAALQKAGAKKSFVSVQCESCHGGRPNHPFADGMGTTAEKVAISTCVQCHTKEQMPAWYDHAGQLKTETVEKAKASVACPR